MDLKTFKIRFWSRVKKTKTCWLWLGCKNKRGYGTSRPIPGDKNSLAHRIAWVLTKGPIPAGMSVLHHCDNPPCVRPGHTFLGTQKDNMFDAGSKGHLSNGPGWLTDTVGAANGRAKLTEKEARLIKTLVDEEYYNGICSDLGKRFNVSPSTIHAIRSGRNWRHI